MNYSLPPHLALVSMEPLTPRKTGLHFEHATFAIIVDEHDSSRFVATVAQATDPVIEWPTSEAFLRMAFSNDGAPRLETGVFVISAAMDYDNPSTVRYRVQRVGDFASFLP